MSEPIVQQEVEAPAMPQAKTGSRRAGIRAWVRRIFIGCMIAGAIPVVLTFLYAPSFVHPVSTLMLKDLHLARQSADAVGAETPLGAEAARLYEAFVSEDVEIRDFSAILPWLAERGRGPA